MEASASDSGPRMPEETTRQRLCNRGWTFEFFQAVRLLEHLTSDAVALGRRGPVAGEAIRFRPHVAVGFPPSDVRRITARTDKDSDASYRVDVTFMGLYGVSTPLPLHYAIDILRASSPSDPSGSHDQASLDQLPSGADENDSSPQRDFLDIFHHRLVSLFYRAWSKYNYDVTFGSDRHDVITRYLLWLIGLAPTISAEDVVVDPVRMIRYAGILTQHPRSSATLEGMLSDYWDGLTAQVRQFVGRWVSLSEEDTNRIGMTNATLGQDLTVGAEVYDLSGAFTVSLGPVDWETYLRFLPDGEDHAQTRALVRLYRVDPLAFGVEMRLKADQVPKLHLASDDSASRLGYTSWVRTGDISETSVTFDESSVRFGATVGGSGGRTATHETEVRG